jgi:thioredoxin 1
VKEEMAESSAENQSAAPVRYELSITTDEAKNGSTRILTRKDKRLELKLPAGISTGRTIKLSNALQLTDNRPGDILVKIKVKVDERKQEAHQGVLEISDASFESEVLQSKLPVLVDFWAPWCSPCHQISPLVEKLAEEFAGRISFCKLNVDNNPLAAGKFQVQSIPLLLFFKNGKVTEQSRGVVPESVIRTKLELLLQ